MCSMCRLVAGRPQKEALRLIGEAMETAMGKDKDHLSDLLDTILGTGEKTDDEQEAKAFQEFEKRRRNPGEET